MTLDPRSHWKMALVHIALLVSFATMSSTASAQACSSNCLRVYSIDLANLGTSIRGIVKLTDESGAGAGPRGSVVHAVWTRPDGSTFDQYANIGTRLRAEFRLYTNAAPGTYTLTVAGATKTGYTFDPGNSSILNKSITVGSAGNQAPTAVFNADVMSGSVPLTVNFDSAGSTDPDGTIAAYAWDFGDGNSSTEASPSHIYNDIGNFNASLTVTDDMGATASNSTAITVTDSNAGCISSCMSVDKITLRYKTRSSRVKALVWLLDENNGRVRDAVVHAVWTLPDGSTVDQYSNIGTRLRAKFRLKGDAVGTYTLTVGV